jgi:hypothetical protein
VTDRHDRHKGRIEGYAIVSEDGMLATADEQQHSAVACGQRERVARVSRPSPSTISNLAQRIERSCMILEEDRAAFLATRTGHAD